MIPSTIRSALAAIACALLGCSSRSDLPRGTPGRLAAAGPFVSTSAGFKHRVDRAFEATISSQGMSLTAPRFSLAIRLEAFGRRDELRSIGEVAPIADGRGVTFQHEGMSEWWRPRVDGLEEGMLIDRRPAGSGPIVARLAIAGGLHAELARDSVNLRDGLDAGRAVLRELHAFDALGRSLPAHFEVDPRSVSLVVDDTNATYPVTIDPSLGTETELQPADITGSYIFGSAVALSGNRLLVGSPGAIVGGGSTGAAYVFDRDASTGKWTQSARITVSDGTSSDSFGSAVVLVGDLAIIAASGRATATSADAGAAYVYLRNTAGTWVLQKMLQPTDLNNSAEFGYSLALSGNTLAVGAPNEDKGAISGAGAVYVYTQSTPGNFTQQARINGKTAADSDSLGISVAASTVGTTTIIASGGPHHTGSVGYGQGAVWVFTRVGAATTWSESQVLAPADGRASDDFGRAVSLDGGTLAIGATGRATSVSSAGAIYVYTRDGTSGLFSQTDVLTASDAKSSDQLGTAVAIQGAIIAAGADGRETATGAPSAGVAYAFTKAASVWSVREFAPTGLPTDALFGVSVALDGGRIAVGASGIPMPSGAVSAGAVYVYEPVEALGVTCARALDCASGFCVDGVCCDKACAGQCEACTAAGACLPLDGAAPHAPKAACASPYKTCTAGVCSTSCKTDIDCAAGAHCDASHACVSDGTLGSACGKATECGSGNCVDGVCCDTACASPCAACDLSGSLRGTCSPVAGAPHGTRACGAGTADPGCGPLCNGTDMLACHDADASVACAKQSCDKFSYTSDGICDGAGKCVASSHECPNHLVCGGDGKCKGSCLVNADCVSGSSCGTDGKCSPPVASKCATDHRSSIAGSTTTACVNGYLCDDATGLCRPLCSATSDCDSGFTCDVTSHICSPSGAGTNPSGGCGTSRGDARGAGISALFAIGLAIGARARRRLRRRLGRRGVGQRTPALRTLQTRRKVSSNSSRKRVGASARFSAQHASILSVCC